jgi:hypothetical protein
MTEPDPWGDLADAVERMNDSRKELIHALDDVEKAAKAIDRSVLFDTAQKAEHIRSDVILATIHQVDINSTVIAAMSLRAGGHIRP